jgi:transposase
VRLSATTKHRLLELFVLGVPSYRQRFRSTTSAASRERFYRLVRASCALIEQLREPFEGAIECDETTFGGARKGKRGWGAAGKVIVFGLVKRNGQVKAMPIAAHDRLSVMREIEAHARGCALLHR